MVSTQHNARDLAAAVIVVTAGFICRISSIEWAVLVLTIGLVFSAEMLNSVAELAVDLLTDRYHPMAKAAKDVGAARYWWQQSPRLVLASLSSGHGCGNCSSVEANRRHAMSVQMTKRERLLAAFAGRRSIGLPWRCGAIFQ